MPDLTPRIGIKKPIGTENVSRASMNENWDIIDGMVETKESADEHKAENASLTTKGHVQLSSATTSTSETLAATPKAVKAAYDRADAAFTSASNGKILVRDAITGKGSTVADADGDGYPTFQELATGVESIKTTPQSGTC